MRKPNRRRQVASKRKFWCMTCDRALVGQYGRCPVCKQRNSTKARALR